MLTYRLCTEKDLAPLCDLSRKTFLSAFKHLNSAENMLAYLDKAYCPEQLLRELNNPYSVFYFAFDGETPIGYIKVNEAPAQTDIYDEASLELERIYLLREFQGLGLGKELLEKAISIGKQKKKRYMWLGVWDKNIKAIAFYQENGFVVVGEHPFVMGNDRQNDFIMRRELLDNNE